MSATLHMYVWQVQPKFIGIAQACSVEKARAMVLLAIATSFDGSCPEREKAHIFVSERNPTIWHGENAEFALTDTAELIEQEHYSQGLFAKLKAAIKERDALAAENARLESELRCIGENSHNAHLAYMEKTAEVRELRECLEAAEKLLDWFDQCGGYPDMAIFNRLVNALRSSITKYATETQMPQREVE